MAKDVTRRTVSKMALAGLIAAESSSLHAQPKTILAVATGPFRDATIDSANPVPPPGVRKYIDGFIAGMRPARTVGTDYIIEYRERPADQLDSVFTPGVVADYILCLSTRVVLAAAHAYPATSPKQIVE